MNYITILRCPVCNAIMDEIRHGNKTGDSYGIALLGGDGRRFHREESPECCKDARWMQGWTQETVPVGELN